MEECFAYDDILRKNGHFIGGEALQHSQNAKTLWFRNGKVVITDGPYAETKEQIGGILLLEAENLNHAVELMAKHPGVIGGGCRTPITDSRKYIGNMRSTPQIPAATNTFLEKRI